MMKAYSFVRENVPRVLAWCKEKNGMLLFEYNQVSVYIYYQTVCSLPP